MPDRPIIVWGPNRRARMSMQHRRARFSTPIPNAKNVTIKTYLYTADELAPTVEAYGKQLCERYTFELAGLSDAERHIVEQAIQKKDGYTVDSGGSVPDALDSLADTFRTHEPIEDFDGGVSGTYITSYDGQIYATRLTYHNDDSSQKTSTTAA